MYFHMVVFMFFPLAHHGACKLQCILTENFSLSESDGGLILPQIVFTVQETAARREAEQLCISQSRSTETVDKLQSGRKPNSFTLRNSGPPRSNCSQLGSRPSPNKPCPRRGDSRRSSGQTRRRSAPDGCH